MILEDTRPSFDDWYLQIAHTAALRGDCRRSQVGAVLVLRDGRTAFFGYNGTKEPGMTGCLLGGCPRGLKTYDERPSTDDYSDCTGVHGEMNVLKTAQKAGADTWGSTVYITRSPCDGCAYQLGLAGVLRIVHA